MFATGSFLRDLKLNAAWWYKTLNTYLAQLISEVVYYLEHKEVYSVEEAYAIIVETYKTYRALLDERTLSIEEIVPEGIIEII